jgi:hypothetical protein
MKVAYTGSQGGENYAVHVKSKEINDIISADWLSNQRVNGWLYGRGCRTDRSRSTNRSCDSITFVQGEDIFTLVFKEAGEYSDLRFTVIGDYGDGSQAEADVAALV